jgi:hypothetical protein
VDNPQSTAGSVPITYSPPFMFFVSSESKNTNGHFKYLCPGCKHFEQMCAFLLEIGGLLSGFSWLFIPISCSFYLIINSIGQLKLSLSLSLLLLLMYIDALFGGNIVAALVF